MKPGQEIQKIDPGYRALLADFHLLPRPEEPPEHAATDRP